MYPVTHLGRIDFRNDNRAFGIRHEDRFSHVCVIGKTGTGKSMALQDLERGNGFALIDPHGDLVARIAARIPAAQRDRAIYLNTTDPVAKKNFLVSAMNSHVNSERIIIRSGRMFEKRFACPTTRLVVSSNW